MKKIKFGASFLLTILICAITKNFLLLINYILALTLHELAHLFVAIKRGYTLKEFKLSAFGVSVELGEKINDKDSFAVNIAGPAINLFLCLICVAMYWLVPISFKILNNFCLANLTLAIFNLIPVYPLDGGKIFASMVADSKKYKILDKAVRMVLLLLCIFGFVWSLKTVPNWFFLLFAMFFCVSKPNKESKMTIFKYSENKKINKVELIKTTGEETLFELLKIIKSRTYTIFYFNKKTPQYLDEDKIIELSTQFPLTSKLKDIM